MYQSVPECTRVYQSVPECTRVYRSLVSVSKTSIIKLSKIGPKCCKMIIKLCIKTGHPIYNLNVSIFELNVQLMRYVCILSSTICINITLFILQWLSVSQCAFFGESRKSGKSHAYWMSDPEYIRMPPCQIQSEYYTVFENHRKSLIQHCERSELRLQFN